MLLTFVLLRKSLILSWSKTTSVGTPTLNMCICVLIYCNKFVIKSFIWQSSDTCTPPNELYWSICQWQIMSQLSIKTCPITWLPKTLASVQLQPNIAKLCPAMVTYSPSNQSPKNNYLRLFLWLVLGKFIKILDEALSWEQLIFFYFFLSLNQIENTGIKNMVILSHGHKLYTGSFSSNSAIIF